jgi:pimeloyl-ACP methyl ester carboxylesterase
MMVRIYGTDGPLVAVLHGGPAAVGEAAPIARGLADAFLALEPWQSGSGVARHVADLHELLRECGGGAPVALVGESWGAMLALACAAAHPESVGPIVLIGCGTFDPAARARMREILDERIDDPLRAPLYDFDPLPPERPDPSLPPFDAQAHRETWADMLRLQEAGVYPAAFAAIRSPVLMLHGAYDPHPGGMIRASLAPHLPGLEYREWERCGHSPWRERQVRDEFFVVLRDWLARRALV